MFLITKYRIRGRGMYSSQFHLPFQAIILKPSCKSLDFRPVCLNLQFSVNQIITMRDRSKNRKPLQRGRVSNEVIQTVQVLKRASYGGGSVEQVLKSRVERLVKSDMIAVLRELQRQNESLLALQIFEVIRKEYWYKPQLFIYADMVMVLANNGLLEKVQQLCSYLKREVLDKDLVGFNVLLRNLMAFDLCQCAVDCFFLMEEAGCEPDETTFRILIKGLELRGEENLVDIIKMEAGKYFIEPYDFLEQEENEELKLTHW